MSKLYRNLQIYFILKSVKTKDITLTFFISQPIL